MWRAVAFFCTGHSQWGKNIYITFCTKAIEYTVRKTLLQLSFFFFLSFYLPSFLPSTVTMFPHFQIPSHTVTQVHEDSYAAHQELQLHIKQCQSNQRSQPLHQKLEHHNSLERDLAKAESILQRLGNMASLLDCMIVQSLVTIIHREVTSFLHIVLKVIN